MECAIKLRTDRNNSKSSAMILSGRFSWMVMVRGTRCGSGAKTVFELRYKSMKLVKAANDEEWDAKEEASSFDVMFSTVSL